MSVPSGGRPTEQATFCATLVDEWRRAGVRQAVICPGSRSTPLVLALAEALEVHVRLDERSAGFFALGLAAASGRPVVVCTTSGTAAAELHPAVVEADLSSVPLLVCTADRPPELHQVGAPQTIDQRHLFASAVRCFADPGVPDSVTAGTWRSLGSRLVAEATAGPKGPGPVHLNLAFREPLLGAPGPLAGGRPGDRPWHAVGVGDQPRGAALEDLGLRTPRRGLLVVGAGCGDPASVVDTGAALGWPVLADPRSGCRLDRPGVVAAADAVLRSEKVRRHLIPEVVVTLGAPWASKVVAAALAEWVAEGTEVVAVDPWWRWWDPDRLVAKVAACEPQALLGALGAEGAARPAAGSWGRGWEAAEDAAQAVFDQALAASPTTALNEPLLGRHLAALVGEGGRLVVSSSMPVRDHEWYGAKLATPPPVWANRGANGIDGVTSTALGMAACGSPVVAVLGDLAFFHDLGALVATAPPAEGAGRLTVVVVDNRGGGIFSFLPQAEVLPSDRFERLFATPVVPCVTRAAAGLEVPATEARTWGELAGAVGHFQGAGGPAGPSVVRAVVPDHRRNVALHDDLHRAVEVAVEGALADAP